MKQIAMRTSLRKKISTAFITLALINAVFAGLAYIDLQFLQHRIQEGQVAADFENTVQEMRRHEKNLFLYDDDKALTEAHDLATVAIDMLNNQYPTLVHISQPQQLAELRQLLTNYRASLDQYRQQADLQKNLLEPIRQQGHHILDMANNLIHAERAAQTLAIQRAQRVLMISLLLLAVMIFGVASVLLRIVITPLRRMTHDMDEIAQGRFNKLETRSNDQELLAFSNAFNHMLNELESRRRHLQHSEKLASLGVLSAGIAHELNNPLSNISSSCQLLLEDLANASHEQLAEWANTIDLETQRARNIVKALLNFGHHHELRFNNVALNDLVQQTLTLLRGAIRQHHAVIETDIANTIQVIGDAQRLQQILINLIRNALDTGTDNLKIHISARISPRLTHFDSNILVAGDIEHFSQLDSPVVHLTIEDNGPGMAPDVYPKIFDPFYTTREPGAGMGLGLYIVQELMEDHDGNIAIFSEPDRGTRVLLQLPTPETGTP
ncbi:MAG: HAMP domain-containing histidine kinase [Gammaproteobacteria bacterium]|nr:HAMP domain-containing histidine kinase [Gammaproteobacteria bacterium]